LAVIATYKFDPSKNNNFLPIFNEGFVNYTVEDEDTDDGYILRTIEHSSLLPSTISFNDSNVTEGLSNESLLSVEYLNITNQMTDLSYLFKDCWALKYINTEDWDTSSATNMSHMFHGCPNLETLDVSGFNTSSVTDMSYMFSYCAYLPEIKGLENFDTSKVESTHNMFENCYSIESLDGVLNWNTSSLTDIYGMFWRCESITNMDFSNWDMSKITDMQYMFYGCSSLQEVNLNYVTIPGDLNNITGIFNFCSGLKTVGLGAFNKNQVDWIIRDLPDGKEINVQLNDSIIGDYINKDNLIFDRFFNVDEIVNIEKLYYFGIYESLNQFSLRGYPPVNGYFIINEDVKLYYQNHIYPMKDGKYIGTFNKLEDINKIGYVVMYEDLYFRNWDARKAVLRGEKYGDKDYHVLNLEGWKKICDSINALKNISNDSLKDDVVDADHTWTSIKIKEQLKETITRVREYINEIQKNKITVAYTHNCPTESKMVNNKLYITPVYKNEHEISHYERFIKINDVKYELGECGHSNNDYYTKDESDVRYPLTESVTMDGNAGLLNSTVSQILNGTKKVNRRTVSTTKTKNTEVKVYEVDTDTLAGKIQYRIINGFQEVSFELTSKGVEATYGNSDEYHGAVIEPAETIFEIPSLNCGDDAKVNDSFISGFMKIDNWPEQEEPAEGEEAQPDKVYRFGNCFINGNKLYIIADLTVADVIYSGYLIYPVWGNEVIR
jgi:surface protein